MNIEKLDHLLSVLRQRMFTYVGEGVPLRMATGDPADRAAMVSGANADWAPVDAGTVWGAPQSYFWFAGTAVVPEQAAGQRLYLYIDAQFGRVMGRSDPQCLVRIDGRIAQGGDFNHREVLLTDCAQAGQSFDILIEAGTIEDRRQLGFGLRLMTHDAEAEALYFDLKTPLDVARHLPETDHRRDLILNTVYAAINAVDLRANAPDFAGSVQAGRQIAARIYDSCDADSAPVITVTGHTHIDVAWLWRVRETRQKMARSMATANALMAEYPDYKFMYNQGYLLDKLSEDYPEVFQGLLDAKGRGQFEVEGALWLEPDANMTSGESLVRHLLRGVRYHRKTFGVKPKIVWLPDTFGYAASMPQIMAAAGIEVFITHKMSWNDTNRMPNEVFWWEGIDGTRIPTYFLTTQPMESTSIGTTYCPDLKASHVMGAWRRYAQKQTQDRLFLVYGHGDGGGGPTREMLEHIRRMERGIPGCPRVEHGHMGPFFDDLVARMNDAPAHYPAWVGELYLEFHRGTFTSVAKVKRDNRKAEAIMREVEMLGVCAMLEGRDYPTQRIEALWDTVLLNQFHDILPGSSIDLVYEDSDAEFAAFFAEAEALIADLSVGVLNCNADTVALIDDPKGQVIYAADGTSVAQSLMQVPAGLSSPVAVTGSVGVAADRLWNDHIDVRFDANGRITSATDRSSGREVLSGPANRLQVFRDYPAQYDAWDIDLTYQDQSWEVDDLFSATVIETGPHRAAIRFEYRYLQSTIVQIVSLSAGARVVEFDTWIDWREQNALLKTTFPTALRTNQVAAEIQFGYVTRPTHRNTSWDVARFECPMHRWVAMTEGGLGVALLNDCKYGYDAIDQTMRLTILRAPTWPWDGADIGVHQLRYGMFIHHGLDEVTPQAAVFNHPPRRLGAGEASVTPVTVSSSTVVVEALKKAEDSDAVILRLVELAGKRQTVSLTLDPRFGQVTEVDLLEQGATVVDPGALDFAPFQIRSFRLKVS